MKKIVILTLCLLLVFAMVGCTSQQQAAEEPAAASSASAPAEGASESAAVPVGDEMTIVLIPKLVHEFYNYVQEGANQAVKELEAQGYKVNVVWSAPTAADVTEQTQKLESAISLNPDYIGIAVINGESVKPMLESAQQNGIKVIAFDTDYEGSTADSFVGASLDAQYHSGEQAADILVKQTGKTEGKVAMLTGSPDAENHKLFSGGFRDRIQAEYPGFEIETEQADNDDKEKATQLTEAILAQYPDVDIIFGGDGSAGVGAGIALQAAIDTGRVEKDQVKISTYCLTADPQASLEAGQISAIIDYSPYYEGYYTVMSAAQEFFNGIELQGVDIPFGIVTMENLDTYSDEYRQICIDSGAEYWNK